MVWRIAPSGSCKTVVAFGLSPRETAFRVWPVSEDEPAKDSAGVPRGMVNSPSAGIRREAMKGIDSGLSLGLRSAVFAMDFGA